MPKLRASAKLMFVCGNLTTLDAHIAADSHSVSAAIVDLKDRDRIESMGLFPSHV